MRKQHLITTHLKNQQELLLHRCVIFTSNKPIPNLFFFSVELRPDLLGEFTALPRPLAGLSGVGEREGRGEEMREAKSRGGNRGMGLGLGKGKGERKGGKGRGRRELLVGGLV